MNRRLQRQLIFLLTVLPAVVFLFVAAIYLIRQVNGLLSHADAILVDELSRWTHREVKVGRVDARSFGTLKVRDLRIANGPTFRSGTLLQADEVVVTYRFSDLVHRRVTPIQSVESIHVVRPKVLLERFRGGRLNIQDLFVAKKGPRRPPFVGFIDAQDGTLVFRDWMAKLPGRTPAVSRLRGLRGSLDAAGAPFYVFNVAGRGSKDQVDSVALTGSTNSRKHTVDVDIRAVNASAWYWTYYFAAPKSVRILDGRADVRLTATRRTVQGAKTWRYVGSSALRNVRASIAGLSAPAEGVGGQLSVANQAVDVKLAGRMVGTPFTLSGSVVSFTKPALNLKIVAPNVEFARMLKVVKLPSSASEVKVIGSGPFELNLVGRSDDLAYLVRATVPAVEDRGYRATGLDLSATYSGGVVTVERLTGDALGGRIALGGTIGLRKASPTLSLAGTASNVQLGVLPQLKRAKLRAVADARFEVIGTTTSPVLTASVQVPNGIIDNVVFNRASAQVTVTSGRVALRSLTAAVAKGAVKLSGRIAGNYLDIRAVAAGVDLGQMLGPFEIEGVSGFGNFDGRIAGATSNPTVTGTAEVFNGVVEKFAFDYARAKLIANRRQIIVEDSIVRVVPAEVSVKGRVTGLGGLTPDFHLNVSVVEAPVQRILSSMKIESDLTGTLAGNLAIRGSGKNLTAIGKLTLTDGALEGYPISQAMADVKYTGGELTLTGLTARSGETTLTASGTVNRDGNLDFVFAAEDVGLARLSKQALPYATLAGMADVSGKVSGTLKSLTASALVMAREPVINAVKFDSFKASVTYTPSEIAAANLVLEGPQGWLTVKQASYNLVSHRVSIEAGRLDNFSYPALYSMLVESPYAGTAGAEELRNRIAKLRRPSSGIVTATFDAAGPVDSIAGSVTLSADKIDIADITNINLQLAASAGNGLITIDSLEAKAKSLNVSAHGTIKEGGDVDLEVDAINVDLGALTPTTGPTHILGTATVNASIVGPIKSPVIKASVDIANPTINGVKLDQLHSGLIEVGRDSIDITKVIITKETTQNNATQVHSATVHGTVPWDWSRLTVPADRPVNLHAAIEQQPLAILATLGRAIDADAKRTSGFFSATLDVTGTIAAPNLGGGIRVTDGRIGVTNMLNDFTDIQADIRFNADEVRVATLSGKSSLGGSFHVNPGGTVSLKNLVNPVQGSPQGLINLAFHVDALAIKESNLSGYRESVNGNISTSESGITLTGAVMRPAVRGTLRADKMTVMMAPIVGSPVAHPYKGRFNPTFDVTLLVGDSVWFSNRTIDALLSGSGHLVGSLSKPDLSANVQIVRGWLRFPTQRLRITSGAVTVSWMPYSTGGLTPEPPHVNVDIKAQTSVMATSSLGSRQRYNIIMTVQGSLLNLGPDNIGLRSDPPGLPRTQILAALGHVEDIFGNGDVALTRQVRDIFQAAVSPLVFNRLESGFIDALGLEDFSIEYGFEQPLAVFVSRHVVGRIYVSYWRVVTGGDQSITGSTYSLRLSYRLKDWLDVGYATDSRRVKVLEAAYSKRF